MPLILQRESANSRPFLALWQGSESLEELTSIATLDEEENKELNQVVLPKRKKEWLTTKILLKQFVPGKKLQVRANGKPFLTEGPFISISHCQDIAGILLSGNEAGLDIQSPDEKLRKIERKFCNADELDFVNSSSNDLDYLTIIWSAKEAVFKSYGEEVHFARDIYIPPFDVNDKMLKALYSGKHGKKEFMLSHHCHLAFHIVHTE